MQKRILYTLLAAALLCASAVLGGCGDKVTAPSEITYKVTVADALGAPCESGTVVKFMQNGQQVAMQLCDENGVASKTLASGEYTIELGFTNSTVTYHYDKNIKLNAVNNEVTVLLSKTVGENAVKLFVSANQFDAYAVTAGCTYVKLTENARSYFLFSPTEAGKYEFTVYDNVNATIGYYGAPHFVQSENIAEMNGKSFTVSVSASMIGTGDTGTSTYVIGIDATDKNDCVLCINRLGEPDRTIEDEPWTIYKKTVELSEYNLPEDAVIKEFDLTAATDAYTLVLNEQDGFYHLGSAEGPLVLMRLAEDCDYIACFKTILDRSGVSRYFYDENGEFSEKVSYSECLLEYIEYVDAIEGVYPLTEDLKHIVTNRGEYVGWWDSASNGYLFKDANGNNDLSINPELAWLLMCCYVE
ncbi:MAG: hypothetical protein IKM32_07800 [Clostridia bacterium]|nr:hypothetical protein [Clostridia bacterium]